MPEDEIDRAVDTRIDAFRAGTVPPFGALQDRKRARDRRRHGLSAAALSVVAITGVALAGPSLTGGDRLTGPSVVAGPATPTVTTSPQPPAPDRTTPGERVAIERVAYALSADGLAVTVIVPVGGGCQTTGTAVVSAVEQDTRVTLRATVARPAAPSPGPVPPGVARSCPADLVTQPATVRLDAPLANRLVVDGADDRQIVPAQDTLGAFLGRCVGGDRGQALPADDYVGMSAADVDRTVAGDGPSIRVVGRDGECLGRTQDLRTDRINVLLAGGTVIWAGRF